MSSFYYFSDNTPEMSVFESVPFDLSQRMEDDMEWLTHNQDELSSYQGQWIAVYGKKVIASGRNGEEAEKLAWKKLGKQPTDLLIHYLEDPLCIYSFV